MKQRIIFLFSFLLFAGYVFGQERIVCDETCEIGDGQTSAVQKGEAGYAVVSPVGRGTVEPIRQAPRLQTLDGKTIAVVGVSFMSRVTHPEIKRLITKHYPTARVLLLDEVGTAGPPLITLCPQSLKASDAKILYDRQQSCNLLAIHQRQQASRHSPSMPS